MTMLPPLRLTGATLLRDGELQQRSLAFENGRITYGPLPEVDMSGYLLLPGIVDLHGDAFERHVAPRPSAPMPLGAALASTERDAAAHGVTTAYMAQCWSWEGGLRGPDFAEAVMLALQDYRPHALIDLRLQLRLETHMPDTRERFLAAIERHKIDYVVFNNHLPEAIDMAVAAPEKFAAWAGRDGRPLEEFRATLCRASQTAPQVARHLCTLAEAFDRMGVHYGSHDDLDGDTRERFRMIGAQIAEFPTAVSAAAAAKAMGDPVIMGAPNVVRGGSQAGNVAAATLIARGQCDALVSDYHYPCLAAAAWALVDKGLCSLPRAWALISQNPADILGLHDRGRLSRGMRADFVVMNEKTRAIEATVAGGRLAYLAGNAAARLLGAVPSMRMAAE